MKNLRQLILCFLTLMFGQARAGSTYTLPIPKPDTRPISLADSIPLKLNETEVSVVGDYGGHKYYESAIPLWKLTSTGEIQETKATLPIGSSVKVLAFVRFQRNYYYRLESQGNTSDYSYIDGRFLSLKLDTTSKVASSTKSPK